MIFDTFSVFQCKIEFKYDCKETSTQFMYDIFGNALYPATDAHFGLIDPHQCNASEKESEGEKL